MKKVEAIIRSERLQAVQDALDELGASGLTVTEVMGCGRQKGYTEQYRGSRVNISLLPKIKVESVVPDHVVDQAVEAIVTRGVHRPARRRPHIHLADRAGGADPHGRARRGDRAPRGPGRLGLLSDFGAPALRRVLLSSHDALEAGRVPSLRGRCQDSSIR